MFYSNFIFVKRGPLAKVWLAAHWQRRLTRTHITNTNIDLSAKTILDPSTPLALRLSGQLLLGLVRIYSKKVQYLQEDCSDALTKIKVVYRPGVVDLPPDQTTAKAADINLPEGSGDAQDMYDLPLENLEDLIRDVEIPVQAASNQRLSDSAASISLSVARADDITLQQSGNGAMDLDIDIDLLDQPLDLDMNNGGADDSALIQFDLDTPIATPSQLSSKTPASAGSESEVETGRAAGPSPALPSPGMGLGLNDTTDISFGGADANSSVDVSMVSHGNIDMDFDMDMDMDAPVEEKTVVQIEEQTVALAEEQVDEVVPKQKKQRKKRKAKVLQIDAKTELSSKEISSGLKPGGAADITLDVRPTMLKRARMERPGYLNVVMLGEEEDDLTNDEIKELIETTFAENCIVPIFRNFDTLAPELQATLQSTLTTTTPIGIPLRDGAEAERRSARLQNEEEEEQQEEKEQEHEQKEQEEEQEQEQKEQEQELQPEFDFDMDMGGDVNSTTDISMASELQSMNSEDFDLGRDDLNDDVRSFFNEQETESQEDAEEKEGQEGKGGWSARTKKMHQHLLNELGSNKRKPKKKELNFETMMAGKNRQAAAVIFYQLLVLKTHKYVDTQQEDAYGDIVIKPDTNFYS